MCIPMDLKEECEMYNFKLSNLTQVNVIDFDRRIYNGEIFRSELLFDIENSEMKEGRKN